MNNAKTTKLKIEKIGGGYLLEWQEHIDKNEQKIKECKTAIVNNGYEEDAKHMEEDTIRRLLYFIANNFENDNSKWSTGNLKISWERKEY